MRRVGERGREAEGRGVERRGEEFCFFYFVFVGFFFVLFFCVSCVFVGECLVEFVRGRESRPFVEVRSPTSSRGRTEQSRKEMTAFVIVHRAPKIFNMTSRRVVRVSIW